MEEGRVTGRTVFAKKAIGVVFTSNIIALGAPSVAPLAWAEPNDAVEGGRMIAVIGGTGFIGRAIVEELLRRGEQVVVLSHGGAQALTIEGTSVVLRQADVTKRASLVAALKDVATVVGAAQFKDSPNENPRKGLTFEA